MTNLVASITQPGCNCGYGYDDNGNITSATLNGKWTGYTYDALGQLVQVNDHSDTRSGADGTTWKYTKTLFCIEFLFTCGESEFLAAILANQYFVFKHLV